MMVYTRQHAFLTRYRWNHDFAMPTLSYARVTGVLWETIRAAPDAVLALVLIVVLTALVVSPVPRTTFPRVKWNRSSTALTPTNLERSLASTFTKVIPEIHIPVFHAISSRKIVTTNILAASIASPPLQLAEAHQDIVSTNEVQESSVQFIQHAHRIEPVSVIQQTESAVSTPRDHNTHGGMDSVWYLHR